MPLSEHEQRLLDDIEKALYADDPKFAASVRTAARRRAGRRWLALSVLGVVIGLGLVLVGLLIKNPIPAVAGFVLVVGGIVYAAVSSRAGSTTANDASSLTGGGTAAGGKRSGGKSKAPANGFRARMEDRMRRRFDDGAA